MTGFEDIVATFAEHRLGQPPVPAGLRPTLVRIGDWTWTTRDSSDLGLYDPPELIDESTRPCADYVAIGVAGHGVNSYFLTCRAVVGPVALFVQTGWAGAYMDHDQQAADLRDLMGQAAAILSRAEGRPADGRRLLVVVSPEKRLDLCQWVAMDGRTWRDLPIARAGYPDSALAAAMDLLEGDRQPNDGSVATTVRLEWQAHGTVRMTERGPWTDGLQAEPALYRFHFADRESPTVYVGETMNVARRMAHYRTGDPELATNKWIHDLMIEHLAAGKALLMDVTTRATVTRGYVTEELDLGDRLDRVLAEAAAINAVPRSDLLNKH